MKSIRCDAVLVQIIATQVDDLGRPIGELMSAPTKVFRATAREFWPEVDKAVAAMMAQTESANGSTPTAAPSMKGKRR